MSDSDGDEDAFAAMCEESEQAIDLYNDDEDAEAVDADGEVAENENEDNVAQDDDLFAEMCADVEDDAIDSESPPAAASMSPGSAIESSRDGGRHESVRSHAAELGEAAPASSSGNPLVPAGPPPSKPKIIREDPPVDTLALGPAPPPPSFAHDIVPAPRKVESTQRTERDHASAESGYPAHQRSATQGDHAPSQGTERRAVMTITNEEVAAPKEDVQDPHDAATAKHPLTLRQPQIKLAPLRRQSVIAASKARKLHKLHSELQDLSSRRQYQDAAKVLSRMKHLGGELAQAQVDEASAKHDVVVKTLNDQERDCVNALKRKWGATLEAFDEETRRQVAAQQKKDATAQQELREKMFEAFRQKPLLFSATVMDLKKRELSLVKAQDYPQAKVLQDKIERIATEERQRALDACLRNIEAAVGNLEAKQARDLHILKDRRGLQLERLRARFRGEEQKIWTKFQTAHRSAGLAHSLSRQTLARAKSDRLQQRAATAGDIVGMYRSSAAERKYAATLASVTSLTAMLHTEELDASTSEADAQLTRGKVRPETAPSGLTVRNPRSRALRRGRGGSRKRSGAKATCNHCTRRLAEPDTWVAIPRDYGRPAQEGIGHFCGWDCAKEWNQAKSPPQLRWARELFIRSMARRRPESGRPSTAAPA